MTISFWKAALSAFALGAMLVMAFAPFYYWPLAIISLAGFFAVTLKQNAIRAFWIGLAFGYGIYGVGVSWVYVSLATYGGMPFWMGAIAVIGFAGILSLFIALPAYIVARFFSSNKRLLVWPMVWLVFEWMKSWVLTGFPWLDVGYSQTPSWLFAWAPLGGVYLVSLVVLVLATLLVQFFNSRRIWPILVSVTLVGSSFVLNRMDWTDPIGQPLSIGVVQANVDINTKWLGSEREVLISRYRTLSQQIQQSIELQDSSKRLDLVVWPETALPVYMQQTNEEFWRNLTPAGSALLTGIVDSPSLSSLTNRSLDESYNAAVLSCDGKTQVYRKRHLVPFGEYLPLRFLFDWVLEYLELPMSDLSSWEGQQELTCADGKINIGLSICYEDAFANEHRRHVGDATVLVNISEDAWFGDSFAPHQRMQMAQMRARELGRPLVRSANSGPSLFIDHRGSVLASTKQFSIQVMSRDVQPYTGTTIYKKIGNWCVYFCILGLVGVLVFSRLRVKLASK
jgi:apolipoprotein N-acyltransferase